ncbi:MAG: TonB-dependent receptor [candidate division KSB1 bacterium]|nr:TonB-dependent receptor [candidate division KSB1 bacterium]MDZ7294192.1 TonB-dependent receptor [candidate division KSB1 bacterium]MDZ7384579.1 TonB-dependent receptor [candidate division KSB1 bacterium]
MWAALTTVALWAAAAAPATAQRYGSIAGTVLSAQTRQPIPGASVMLEGTLLGAATDARGNFLLPRVPPGRYSVKASMIGFAIVSKPNVEVRAGERTELVILMEETIIEAPSVVVTASKRYQEIADSPVSVSVVSQARLNQIGEFNLEQILQYAPGVNFMGSQVNIRGSSGYSHGAGTRVLYLVDGVPILPGDSGDIKWDLISPGQIDHIEIVKGAGSALYGSSAMGGVINIITKEPTPRPVTQVRLLGGFYDQPAYPEWRWTDRLLHFNETSISHSRRFDGGELMIAGGRTESLGYRENGNLLRYNLTAKLGWRISPQVHLALTSNWNGSEYGSSFMWQSQNHPLQAPEAAVGDKVKSWKANFNAVYRHALSEKVGLKGRLSYFRNRWENFFHDNNDYSSAEKVGFEVQSDFLPGRGHALTAGVEGTFDRVQSTMFDNHEAYNLAFYAQDEFKLPWRFQLTVGGRFDLSHIDIGIDDQQLSPKVGLVWKARQGTTLRLSSGRGFRAPSVAERFTDVVVSGLRVVPNLNLRAESAWSHEIGVNHQCTRYLLADLAFFHSQYRDLIEPEPDASGTVRFVNVTEARIRGLEVNLQASLWRGRLTPALSYTFLEPWDLTDDDYLAYRARHLLTATVSVSYGPLRVGADYRYVSRLERVKVYPRDQRVPQKVTDVRLGYRLLGAEIGFDVANLFNYNYTQVERTLMPIRHYTFTIARTF